MKRLVLLRHGHSPFGFGSDFDRRLDERGRRGVQAAATALRDLGFLPELILASAARRTQETAALAAAVLGDPPPPVRALEALYSAGAREALELLVEGAGDAAAVLVVGHNPTLSELATVLGPDPVGLAPGEFWGADFPAEDWALVETTAPLRVHTL
ncbi:MAG: histidine phosphatase family protein [Planctomycetota bacterium]